MKEVGTRVVQYIAECLDEENRKFDWDAFQYLCDCADYWDSEE